MSWLEQAVVVTIANMDVKNSTKQTYLNALLGAIGRTTWLWEYDTTHIIKKCSPVTAYQRALEKGKGPSRQATPAPEETMRQIVESDNKTDIHLAAMFLLAARVADYINNLQTVAITGNGTTIEIQYNKHKTVGSIGRQAATAPIPWKGFRTAWNQRNENPSPAEIDERLRHYNWTRHSIRRGGLRFWRSQGKTTEFLLALSLHTSAQQLTRYLSV